MAIAQANPLDPNQIQTRLAIGDYLGSPQGYATPPSPTTGFPGPFNLQMPTYSDMYGQDVSQLRGIINSMYPAGTKTIQQQDLAQQGAENSADLAEQQRQYNDSLGYDYDSLNSGKGSGSSGSSDDNSLSSTLGISGLGNSAAERAQQATAVVQLQAQQFAAQGNKSYEDVMWSILNNPVGMAGGANLPLVMDELSDGLAGSSFLDYVKQYNATYTPAKINSMQGNQQTQAQALQITKTKAKLNSMAAQYNSLVLRQTDSTKVLGDDSGGTLSNQNTGQGSGTGTIGTGQ